MESSRILKFRAWDKESGVMCNMFHDSCLISVDHTVLTIDIAHVHEDTRIEDMIIMQFTGLQDSQGVDIYEGDVVRTSTGRIGKIEWDSECVMFSILS